jgi:flagellar basal-body rod protein FlgC
MLSALSIGTQGMQAAEKRLQVSANNIANSQSEGAVETQPTASTTPAMGATVYKPQTVEQTARSGGGVSTRVTERNDFTRTYNPDAPYADRKGMVATPNVDTAREMVDQISASLQFSANLKTVQTAANMTSQALSVLA